MHYGSASKVLAKRMLKYSKTLLCIADRVERSNSKSSGGTMVLPDHDCKPAALAALRAVLADFVDPDTPHHVQVLPLSIPSEPRIAYTCMEDIERQHHIAQ